MNMEEKGLEGGRYTSLHQSLGSIPPSHPLLPPVERLDG